ncbi:MAG TPA: PAS domain S-box protein [Dehalococcoidia bacterium]|nr:PAS domain S-box protein [Dehalococcoidia bacterium]
MKVAEKIHRYRRLILIVAVTLMFGTLFLYTFTERYRDIHATIETAASKEVAYLLDNLNTRLLAISEDLPDGHHKPLPDSQSEHLILTSHLLETNHFIQAINFIGPDHHIEFVLPYGPDLSFIGTGIENEAPGRALEMAASSKEPYLSAPYDISPEVPGYSLIVPVRNDGFFMVIFSAESVFSDSSPFVAGSDVLIRVSDRSSPVFTPAGYQDQLSRSITYQVAVEGAILNRTTQFEILPTDALLSTGSRFWQILGISSLTVSFVLLFSIILAQMLEGNRRKRAEDELKLEAKLMDAATDAVFLCDLSGNLTYSNDTACRTYGHTRNEFLEMNLINLGIPDDIQVIKSGMQTLLESGDVTLEFNGLRKDGSQLPVEMHAHTIAYSGMKLILSAVRDITERKLAEEALKESEEQYHLIFDTAANLITSIDRQGTIIECNARVYPVLGYTHDELIGQSISSFIHPDYVALVQKFLQETLLNGFTYGAEYKMVRKDGKVIDVSVDSSGVTNKEGEYIRIICIVSDITENQRMEKEIKLAYAELERIFNATADGMRVIDTDFNVIRVNDAYTFLSGLDKRKVLSRKCYEDMGNQLCHTQYCPMARITSGDAYIEGETENERSNGDKVACILAATPLRGPDNELMGIIESLKDITDLRKTQEQLQHSQLLASLGEMTAGIAHEVNNPLGSVLLYSELLMAGNVPQQTKADLKVIHDEAKRAARIMTDLLTYSRRIKYQVRRLDLHRILEKLLEMRRYTERVHNIVVTPDFAEGPLWVRGDSSQLKQLFMNLMLNAEEAVKESGSGQIKVTTSKDNEWVRIYFTDNGKGIPPENLKQVFFPFFTTKDVGEGTGLGLSTCYGIVTNHNGLIHAENNEAGGAAFIVELPLAISRKQKVLVQAGSDVE